MWYQLLNIPTQGVNQDEVALLFESTWRPSNRKQDPFPERRTNLDEAKFQGHARGLPHVLLVLSPPADEADVPAVALPVEDVVLGGGRRLDGARGEAVQGVVAAGVSVLAFVLQLVVGQLEGQVNRQYLKLYNLLSSQRS